MVIKNPFTLYPGCDKIAPHLCTTLIKLLVHGQTMDNYSIR